MSADGHSTAAEKRITALEYMSAMRFNCTSNSYEQCICLCKMRACRYSHELTGDAMLVYRHVFSCATNQMAVFVEF